MLGGLVVMQMAANLDQDCVDLYQSTAATLDILAALDLLEEANRETVKNAGVRTTR